MNAPHEKCGSLECPYCGVENVDRHEARIRVDGINYWPARRVTTMVRFSSVVGFCLGAAAAYGMLQL